MHAFSKRIVKRYGYVFPIDFCSNILSEVSGNTFTYNAGASLAELESLIQSKPSEDQAVLNEMLEVLREIQSSEEPVDKGRLARFYEVVQKSSDLLLPIGNFLFQIFFRA